MAQKYLDFFLSAFGFIPNVSVIVEIASFCMFNCCLLPFMQFVCIVLLFYWYSTFPEQTSQSASQDIKKNETNKNNRAK